MIRILQFLSNLFPIWVLGGCLLALLHPPLFTWFKGELIIWGLSIIMLGMGMTLRLEDFRKVLQMPFAIAGGVAAQFLIMPFLGYGIAVLLALPEAFAVGLILTACCLGGTASNVVAYIARANVALSVLLTMCSTLIAIIATPLLTGLLAGQFVEVNVWGLFLNTLRIVLLPILLGIFLHNQFPKSVEAILPIGPFIAVIAIMLICASIIGSNADQVIEHGLLLLAAVGTLHLSAFALGYGFARALGYEELTRRTVSIEVGMQNSGLATYLAKANFASLILAPVPCAISACLHSIIGSILAAYWRNVSVKERSEESRS